MKTRSLKSLKRVITKIRAKEGTKERLLEEYNNYQGRITRGMTRDLGENIKNDCLLCIGNLCLYEENKQFSLFKDFYKSIFLFGF